MESRDPYERAQRALELIDTAIALLHASAYDFAEAPLSDVRAEQAAHDLAIGLSMNVGMRAGALQRKKRAKRRDG